MRMASNCYTCIMDRAKFEGDLVFSDDAPKKEVMEELLDFMACHKGGVPALVGTERERILKRKSGRDDPYRDIKAESNRVAQRLVPLAREFYEQSQNKLEALIRIAAAANSMEYGVKGHDFDNATFSQVFRKTLEERLAGDLDEVKRRLEAFDRILYLTDNCGEMVFDLFVIEKLEEMGKKVVIGSKSEPILNDVTAEEISALTNTPVVPTGPVVGTTLEDSSPEALKLLRDRNWLILAKGMGNFETMSEYDDQLKGRLIYVMRAKCEPVAMTVGVSRGMLVVRPV
ncbi:MAG: DUF89 family protein [Methanotrichaceae archaeon]|nr:DUF89 family protein [Methanotrichaceae archaeon]